MRQRHCKPVTTAFLALVVGLCLALNLPGEASAQAEGMRENRSGSADGDEKVNDQPGDSGTEDVSMDGDARKAKAAPNDSAEGEGGAESVELPPIAPGTPSSYDTQPPPRLSSPLLNQGTRDQAGTPEIPGRIRTRLRVLGQDLNFLGGRGSGYIVDGIVSILMGGLTITLGALSDDKNFSNYLYLFGASAALRGILVLSLTPNASDVAVDYAHMPMSSVEEIKQRLAFGEKALEDIAFRSKVLRLTDASLAVATAGAVFPVYFVPNDFRFSDASDIFVLVAASISLVTGIVGFAIKSPAEKRWNAYKKLRAELIAKRKQELGMGPATTTRTPLDPPRQNYVLNLGLGF